MKYLFLFMSLLSSAGISHAADAVILSEFIYETAPFPECHASTIAETPSGLVAAWFGGKKEKNPDVGIWVARHTDGKWTAPVEVANGVQYVKPDGTAHRHPTWNPVLFQPRKGPLLLFYKCGPNPDSWWGMLTTSTDHGKTWSTPARLPEHIDGPVKNKPVQLPNGDLLCPSSTENDGWRVHFERTSDLGKTWTRTGPVNDGKAIEAIQPSILFTGGDDLLAVGRTKNNRLFQISSTDAGKTWGSMTLGTLPNPNSGIDAVTLKDGRHLLVYNHVGRILGRWGGERSPLNLAVSKDGVSWQAALVLENEPGAEFSYPAIIQGKDGKVHITYTWKRKKVKHIVVDPALLEGKDMPGGAWPE
jgi:predicted neuraminidase